MTPKEVAESLELKTYEYCNKKKIIESKTAKDPEDKLGEIMKISQALDEEQISYTVDPDSNFVNLFDHKI